MVGECQSASPVDSKRRTRRHGIEPDALEMTAGTATFTELEGVGLTRDRHTAAAMSSKHLSDCGTQYDVGETHPFQRLYAIMRAAHRRECAGVPLFAQA